MRFSAVGISHWKSEVSIRELFYLDENRKQLLKELTNEIPGGVLILDTCNRTELYAFCSSKNLIAAFCEATKTDPAFFSKHGYSYSGKEAYDHLFEVGVGLDSQVLGDVQIIQQVKKAYKTAAKKHLSGEFHQLLQAVFRTHKRTRHETKFGRGTASVGFAATQLAVDYFSELKNIRILLVGAGKMGKVSCKNLISNGAVHISVVNRSIDRAKKLASSFDIQAHAFSSLEEEIKRADLIITATGANAPVLLPHHFTGNQDPKLVLDLSVPRNVDPKVGELEHITLVDMDSISKENKKALEIRKEAIPDVIDIIDEERDEFLRSVARSKYLLPRIQEIDKHLSEITEKELNRVQNKLDARAFEEIEKVTGRIKKKILAIHINRLDEEFEKYTNEA